MKKVLAILLMLVLAFSAAAVVSAADDEVAFIEKGWVDESGKTLSEGKYPEIEIEFEIVSKRAVDNTFEDYNTASNIPDVEFVKDASSTDIVVSGAENIQGAGMFEYVIKEKDPGVAGVTVNDTEYTVQVLRTFVMENDTATDKLETSSVVVLPVGGSNEKPEIINNTYVDGDLAIDVAVTGNLSDKYDDFTVEIVITSDKPVETDVVLPDGTVITFEKKDDGTYEGKGTVTINDNDGVKTVTGIPEGVTVTVTEKNPDPYELVDYDDGENKTTTAPSFTMSAAGESVVITNHYSTEIDTGISLDSLPYILIIAAVGGAAVFYFIRKRRNALDMD